MEFFTWAGWGFVGAIAQIIGLIAVVFAIAEFANRRVAYPAGEWVLERVATVSRGDQGPWDDYELTNIGSGTVHVTKFVILGATLVDGDGYRLGYSYNPGTTSKFLLDVHVPERAWIHITWRDVKDRRFTYATWVNLLDMDPIEHEFDAAWGRQPRYRWWMGLRRGNNPRLVAPGGVVKGVARTTGKDERVLARLAAQFPREDSEWLTVPAMVLYPRRPPREATHPEDVKASI